MSANTSECETTETMKPRDIISQWLGKSMKIGMSDGRTLVGQFLCTDQAKNVILGSAQEYLNYSEDNCKEDPRMLGLAMVPGKHIVSILKIPKASVHKRSRDEVFAVEFL